MFVCMHCEDEVETVEQVVSTRGWATYSCAIRPCECCSSPCNPRCIETYDQECDDSGTDDEETDYFRCPSCGHQEGDPRDLFRQQKRTCECAACGDSTCELDTTCSDCGQEDCEQCRRNFGPLETEQDEEETERDDVSHYLALARTEEDE